MKLEMAVNKSEEWRLCCRYTKGKEISNKQLNKEEVRSSKQGSKTIFLDATGTDFERLNTHDSSGREGIQIQRQDRTGSWPHPHPHCGNFGECWVPPLPPHCHASWLKWNGLISVTNIFLSLLGAVLTDSLFPVVLHYYSFWSIMYCISILYVHSCNYTCYMLLHPTSWHLL